MYRQSLGRERDRARLRGAAFLSKHLEAKTDFEMFRSPKRSGDPNRQPTIHPASRKKWPACRIRVLRSAYRARVGASEFLPARRQFVVLVGRRQPKMCVAVRPVRFV